MKEDRKLAMPIIRPIAKDHLVTHSDLKEFKKELLVAIQGILSPVLASQPKKWLKSYEVRKILGISATTLQTLRSNGTLPSCKIGNLVYFDAEAIDQVMRKRCKRT